jgi:predicted Zn-dependent peptidase
MPLAPRQTRATLDNGLPVIAVELPHLHSASLGCFVRIGSRFESADEAGLSHFVEHMLHRGTERHPDSLALHHAIDDLGAELVADTGPSFSRFVLGMDPDNLGDAMALLGELVGRPGFADLELERELVLEELDAAGSDPESGDLARELLFGDDHPLARSVLGDHGNVASFTAEEVTAHYQRYYRAGNMLVVAAGPFEPEAVIEHARAQLGFLPAGPAVELEPSPVSATGPRVRFAGRDDRADVAVLFRIDSGSVDRAALTALSYAIDGGMSSRLHYRLCDQRGLAYEVGASIEELEDVAVLDIGAETSPGKVIDLIDEILAIPEELVRTPLSRGELARIRRLHRLDTLALLDSADALTTRLGSTALYREVPAIDDVLTAMDALDAAAVRQAATQIFRPEALAVAITGRLSAATRGETRALITEWLG